MIVTKLMNRECTGSDNKKVPLLLYRLAVPKIIGSAAQGKARLVMK